MSVGSGFGLDHHLKFAAGGKGKKRSRSTRLKGYIANSVLPWCFVHIQAGMASLYIPFELDNIEISSVCMCPAVRLTAHGEVSKRYISYDYDRSLADDVSLGAYLTGTMSLTPAQGFPFSTSILMYISTCR